MVRLLPLLAGVGLLSSAPIAGAEPLLSNGDFSALTGAGSPEGWQTPEGLAGLAKVVDDDGHSGSHSLGFRFDEPTEAPAVTQTVACEPNTEYVLSAWMKSDGLRPGVRVLGTAGDREWTLVAVESEGETSWGGASARFNSGNLGELTVSLVPHGPAGDGQVPVGAAWFDDVQVFPAAEYREEAGEPGGGYAGPPPGRNLALGKPHTLSPAPNYRYCTEEGDATQLTDGEHSVGYFWVQEATVGWSNTSKVDITIDLGSAQPIKGCSYNTAAGVAGVAWPALVYILVSDDGETWHPAGDLVARSAKFGLPAADRYSSHRFVADDLALHGRYFRLLIAPSGSYTFCDEIEVYEGPAELMTAELEPPVQDPAEVVLSERVVASVRQRLLKDIATFRQEADQAGISNETKAWAEDEAARLAAEAQKPMGPFDVMWRAIHPLTDTHAGIYRARARVKRELGAPEFAVWQKCRWDMLDPMELPAEGAKAPELSVAMLQGEYRSEAFNLTNMGDEEATFWIWIDGVPGAPAPTYVTVHQVEWVETQSGIPVADALPIAPEGGKMSAVRVPSGMTRQVWLTFHPADLPAGTHQGSLSVVSNPDIGGPQVDVAVPLRLRVYPREMPERLSCSLGMWDYSCVRAYDLTEGNVDEAIANMLSHRLNTPWLHGGCAPWPKGFDADGNLTEELDFSRFDGWLADWADAANYAAFLHVGSSLAGVPMTDERFPACVATWMHAWVDHLRELDVKPSQLMLLLVDEPSREEQELRIITWAKAIEAAEPEVVIWEDPVHRQPEEATLPEVFEVSDVLCPNLAIFASGSEVSRQFYADLRERGKTLWFYQCSGPAKTYDPYYYHRLQHWYCFKYGAVGSGFWAYGDAAGGGTSWNELRAGRTSYTPVYIDPESITDGKHMEAVREGLEDYETLCMLRDHADRLEAEGQQQRAERARTLLRQAVDDVCGEGYEPGQVSWLVDKDRGAADRARERILEELARG